MIKNLAIGSGSTRALALAVALGLLSAVLIGVFLSQLDKGSSGGGGVSGDTAPAVVAAQDIPTQTRITAGMLTVKQLPVDLVLSGAFTSIDGIEGQVAQVPIVSGEQVVASKLTTAEVALSRFGANTPASLLVPEGKRAFAIHLSEVGAAGGLVRPGDFVDVILSAGVSKEGFLTPGSACFVIQDVQVLAISSALKQGGAEGDVNAIAGASANPDAKSATLAVTPEESWWLAAAQQSVNENNVGNQLWVALRPFGDHAQSQSLPICGVVPGQ